jgi:superfamily II DNA or RNA helicase/ubiquinone/menaquinone biosynthesis C-methylase UbiE
MANGRRGILRSAVLARPPKAVLLREEIPLSELSDNPSKLLDIALTRSSSSRGKLAARLLASSGEENLRLLYRRAKGLSQEDKEDLFKVVAEELEEKPFKENKELVFIAVFGNERIALKAETELENRGAVYELLAVAKTSRIDEVKDFAAYGILESQAFVDVFVSAITAYHKSDFRGYFKEFVSRPESKVNCDAETRRNIGFLKKLFAHMEDNLWDEFSSDISLFPIISKVTSLAADSNRKDELTEIFETMLGAKFAKIASSGIESIKPLTSESIAKHLSQCECGKKLLKSADEWMNIKVELNGNRYEHLHDCADVFFLLDSHEEIILRLLPQDARDRIAQEMEKDLDILFSPILTETEKEETIGTSERLARVSLNLGLIQTPLPSAFADANAFEKHVERVTFVLRKKFTDEQIESFLANRIITSIMETTRFQDGMDQAQKLLTAIRGRTLIESKGKDETQKKIVNKVFQGLQSFIDYYKELIEQGKSRIDFYQAIRIKSFMDHGRILVGDGTGTGKTIVALGAKDALDKELKKKGEDRRSRVLVLAPSTGTDASWGQEKMDEYCRMFNIERQKVLIVKRPSDLRKLEKGDVHYDMVIFGYGKLGTLPEKNKWLGRLTKLEFDAVFFDEVHKVKNFQSNTGKCTKKIIERYKDKRTIALSATLIPNTLDDGIGMLLYISDPDKHADAENYTYNNDPELVRGLWLGQRWFRRTLAQVRGYDNAKERTQEVELYDEEAECYFDMWQQCAYTGLKYSKLQRFLISKELAEKKGIRRSAKLDALDRIVEQSVKEGKKVIIWSPLVEVVTESLMHRYEQHGSIRIDGSVTATAQRYKKSKTFRKSRLINVLVISTVADEAIDLSCGSTPVVLVRLIPPITPRDKIQSAGRADRRTQEAPVEIINLIGKSETLTRMMVSFVNNDLAQYGINPPKRFLAQTIDVDVAKLLEWKLYITEKIFKGEKLSDRDMGIWKATDVDQARRYLKSSINDRKRNIPPFVKVIFIDHKFRGAGAEKVAEAMQSGVGEAYAKFYEQGWKGSHSQNTLELIKKLMIEKDYELGEKGKTRILDLGGGAAYTSRTLNHPTTIVDLNTHFLNKAKEVCDKLGIENTYIEGDMRHTGAEKGSYDCAVASYSLHHLKQTAQERQVEEVLLEMNRVLREGAEFYMTFPWSAGDDVLDRFASGLKAYGFEVDEDSGVYQPVFDDKKKGKKVLILVARRGNKDVTELASPNEWEKFVVFTEKSRTRLSVDRHKSEKSDKKKKEEKKKLVGFKKVKSIV